MKYIIGNWKCNPATAKDAAKIFAGYKKLIKKSKKVEVAACPPFCYLAAAKPVLKGAAALGGQNCFWEEGGAFTGEIAAAQLAAMGCKYVIIGHSERRKYFAESNDVINKKIKLALANGLVPILCCGETREERIGGKITGVVETQVKEGLKDIDPGETPVIVAYEPVWAIGTGESCGAAEAKFVRDFISNAISDKIPVLYGGSANAGNAAAYLGEAGFDGLLIGKVSLDPKEFSQIAELAKKI